MKATLNRLFFPELHNGDIRINLSLSKEDILYISYGISWIKQSVFNGDWPSGHMAKTLELLEDIIGASEDANI